MAGLFDDFGLAPANDPAQMRKALEAQQQAQIAKVGEGNVSRRGKQGSRIVQGLLGLGAAGTFGEGIKEELGVEDEPELVATRKQGELVKTLQGLPGDPSSAAYATQAAREALAAGRPDLALKFRNAAGERAKAEASAASKVATEADSERRAELTGLGTSARNEFIAMNPDYLVENLNLTPDQAQAISDGVAEQNNLRRLKLKADLDDVGKATTTKVSASDIAQTTGHLANNGIDLSSLGFNSTEEDLDAFASPIASEVRRRMDVLKDSGQRGNEAAITTEVLKELIDGGAIQVSPQFFGGDEGELNIDSVDKIKFNSILSDTEDVDFDFSK